MNIPQHIITILAAMTISGSCATLNGNLSRQDYVTTNEVLETLGAKWSRKEKCHRFQTDAQSALSKVLNAPTPEIYTAKEKKKDFQFFGTPAALADELVNVSEYHFPYAAPDGGILDQKAFLQEEVNQTWQTFKDAVNTKRSIAEDDMQGQTFTGEALIAKGFVDGFADDLEEVIQTLAA